MKYLSIVLFMFLMNLANAETIYDESRQRNIPVDITFPTDFAQCSTHTQCAVALLSAGYGVSHTEYTFLSEQLNQLGYLVVAVRHELPSDPPLSVVGDLYKTRSENWARGAKTLDVLVDMLSKRFIHYDFNKLLLVGHSNGGDISAWLGNDEKPYIESIITLDHRRVPLPRTDKIHVFSIRGSDFPADKGVLPTTDEQIVYSSCVVKIPKSKHNDMSDSGPAWLKNKIAKLMKHYLKRTPCHRLSTY